MDSFNNLMEVIMTKYVVFVNEFNSNANESVSFEETFNSLKDVVQYVNRFNYRQHCNGHVEKWTKRPGDEDYLSEIIMRF